MSNQHLLLSLPVLLAAATSLLGQNQSKPAAAGVRSAAPAQIPGQSVRSAPTKNYRVAKAHDGSTMGVWSQLNPDNSETVVKFAIASNVISAVSSKQDSSGAKIASAFTAVFLDQAKAGTDAVRGFTHSVGPQNKEDARAHGAFPVALPDGLKRELLELGKIARFVKDLERLVEAKTAAEAIAGGVFGGHSMPSATDDPFLKRRELPKDMRDSPAAGLPGRDGRASGEGELGARAPKEPAPSGTPSVPVPFFPLRTTEHTASSPKDPNAPLGSAGIGKARYAATMSDSDTLESLTAEVSPRNNTTGGSGSGSSATSTTPRSGNREVVGTVDPTEHITETYYRNGNIRSRDISRTGGSSFRAGPGGGGTGPAENPSEGGSSGIDPAAWKVLRGTGMGVALYNDWLKKQNHDFFAPLRQPGRDNQVGRPVREVPKVGRTAVVNPTEGGGRGGARPKIPDMKDPAKPDEGGGQPVPRPRP